MSGNDKNVKKEWSEFQRSKMHLLYKDLKSIGSKDASVELCGKTYHVQDVLRFVLDKLPFMSKATKQPTVPIHEITKNDVEKINTFLDTMVKCPTINVTAQFVRLLDFGPKVKFWHAEYKKGALYPARMLIDLKDEDIKEGESVMINTGYSVRIPFLTNARSVDKAKKTVIIDKTITKQPDFIIVPLITCDQNSHIIPSIYARDQDDTGLFTINFTLVKGKLERLQVVFNAYLTDRPNTNVELLDPIPNQLIFKPKDSKNGRSVKNLKVKVHYDRMEVNTEKNKVVFPTYDVTVKPIVTYPDQKLSITDQQILFTSRRREWINPELVTLSGIFLNKNKYVTPRVLKTEDQERNTHCLAFLRGKVMLFSETPKNWLYQDFKIINGSFKNTENFDESVKLLKQTTMCINGLAVGYDLISKQTSKGAINIPIEQLLKIYDYHRHITLNSIETLSTLDDEELFNKRIGNFSAYSVVLYKAILKLLQMYMADQLNDAQLATIQNVLKDIRKETANGNDSASVAAVSADAGIRKIEEIDDVDADAAGTEPKRVKLV